MYLIMRQVSSFSLPESCQRLPGVGERGRATLACVRIKPSSSLVGLANQIRNDDGNEQCRGSPI